MDISRRWFLRGTLAVASIAVAPKIVTAISYPEIYGDGVSDDSPGLNAFLSGKPVIVEGELITNNTEYSYLVNGYYYCKTDINVERDYTVISRNTFKSDRKSKMLVKNCKYVDISNNVFIEFDTGLDIDNRSTEYVSVTRNMITNCNIAVKLN